MYRRGTWLPYLQTPRRALRLASHPVTTRELYALYSLNPLRFPELRPLLPALPARENRSSQSLNLFPSNSPARCTPLQHIFKLRLETALSQYSLTPPSIRPEVYDPPEKVLTGA